MGPRNYSCTNNSSRFTTTDYARVLLFIIIIRRELGRTGTGCYISLHTAINPLYTGEFYTWFDAMGQGRFIVHVKGSQVRLSNERTFFSGAGPGFLEWGFRCVKKGVALLILSHFS